MHIAFLSPIEPERRVGRLIADTPHFAWAFDFLRAFPKSDVIVTGGTVRDALLGRTPAGYHLLILGHEPVRTKAWLANRPAPADFDIKLADDDLRSHLDRSDFTVNAMGYSLKHGELSDPHGGVVDLSNAKLRTVGDAHKRLRQDPLMGLRALRMSAHLGARIAKDLWQAASANMHRLHALDSDQYGRARYKIPRHHLAKEKLLTLQHQPVFGWDLLHGSGAHEHLFTHTRDEAARERIAQTLGGLHDAGIRMRYAPAEKTGSLIAAGVVSTHPEAERLHRDHGDRYHYHKAAHPHLDFAHDDSTDLLRRTRIIREENPQLWSLSKAEKVLGGERGAQALSLAHATSLALPREQEAMRYVERAAVLRDRFANQDRAPQLIRGRDLLPLGIAPGPHVRQILGRIRDEQLKGNVQSHQEAIDLARILLKPKYT